MRSFIAGALLLLFAFQSNAQTWSTVPAPTLAPVCSTQKADQNNPNSPLSPTHCSDYVWRHPFDRPSPGGTYEVSNAVFDKDGKIGAWSQPATLTVKSGWMLQGGAWNQPIYEDGCGIAWRVKVVWITPSDAFEGNPWQTGSEHYFYTGWGGSYVENDAAPYSGQLPYLQPLTQDAWRSFTLAKFPAGGVHTLVAPPPPVEASSLPNSPCEIAYCRVTETGETALSPHYQFVGLTYPADRVKAGAIQLNMNISEFHPQGTLGYHVYWRKSAESVWQRIQAPQCLGTPVTADDWLFPVWQRQFTVKRLSKNLMGLIVPHAPAASPQSRLSWLHKMLRGDPVKDADVIPSPGLFTGDVICKAGQIFDVYCPVIDEWGNGDSGTTGAPPNQKFGRRIQSATGGKWFIRQQPNQSGHTAWPVLLVHNQYSRWTGVNIQANGGDAVASSDYSGGQAFGNQFHECNLNAAAIPGRVTCGVRIDTRSSFWSGGHTGSEWYLRDTGVGGSIPLYFDGNQTANIRLERIFANSYGHDARSSVAYIGCPSPFRFYNGFYCDAYQYGNPDAVSANNLRGTIFNTVGPVNIETEGMWIDQGFKRFIVANNTSQLRIRGGKMNLRGLNPALGLNVGTIGQPPSWAAPNSPPALSTWLFEDVTTQPDPGTNQPRIISSTFRQVNPLMERTPLASAILQEPNEAVATSRLQRLSGPAAQLRAREIPGYRIPSAGGLLIVNSLTTGKPVERDGGVIIIP